VDRLDILLFTAAADTLPIEEEMLPSCKAALLTPTSRTGSAGAEEDTDKAPDTAAPCEAALVATAAGISSTRDTDEDEDADKVTEEDEPCEAPLLATAAGISSTRGSDEDEDEDNAGKADEDEDEDEDEDNGGATGNAASILANWPRAACS